MSILSAFWTKKKITVNFGFYIQNCFGDTIPIVEKTVNYKPHECPLSVWEYLEK